MVQSGEWFNILLGLCAVGYSLIPPHRVRNYRRGLALALRWLGVALLALAAAGLLLQAFTT